MAARYWGKLECNPMASMQDSTQDQLRRYISDKFAEAKSAGFDVNILRQVLRLRKKDKTDRDEEQAILDVYMHALGDLSDTPLGDYAVKVHKIARAHGIPKNTADAVIAEAS